MCPNNLSYNGIFYPTTKTSKRQSSWARGKIYYLFTLCTVIIKTGILCEVLEDWSHRLYSFTKRAANGIDEKEIH